jgi:acyl-CoA reductase-like NAD-dependent aldehyde dehydrogenase
VAAAEKAFRESPWAKLPPNERAVFLHRLADLVEKRKEVLAQLESFDCGKILSQAVTDINNFCTTMVMR